MKTSIYCIFALFVINANASPWYDEKRRSDDINRQMFVDAPVSIVDGPSADSSVVQERLFFGSDWIADDLKNKYGVDDSSANHGDDDNVLTLEQRVEALEQRVEALENNDLVKYHDAETTLWCKESKPIEGRNGCMNDADCLENARSQCDNDPKCYGVSWYPNVSKQKMKLCLSEKMEPKTDGWRTMMKRRFY